MNERLLDITSSIHNNIVSDSVEFWSFQIDSLEEIFDFSQNLGDEKSSNTCWFLIKLSKSKVLYLSAFQDILDKKYYEAWCSLEIIEINISWLIKNNFLDLHVFQLNEFSDAIKSWQSLYPYKFFISPGIIIKEKLCSICETKIGPWSSCTHEKGLVYNGKECVHNVTKAEFTEISLVLDPVQKYSVLRGFNDEHGNMVDHHDYSLVKFVAERLHSPFDKWKAVWTKAYHSHELFKHADLEQGCPCESGHSYRECCRTRLGVIRPHLNVQFDVPPREDLSAFELAGYSS